MKTIHYSIIILATFLLAWIIPDLYHLTTDKASKNKFTYFSSVEKSFCMLDYDEQNDNLIRKNIQTGKEYTEAEFDSILPLFYYRQLLSEGRLPDSIQGKEINSKIIQQKSFFFRYQPTDKNTPKIPLYTLFESISGRVDIDMPGDVFRVKDKIEFIDPETNSVKKQKSELFEKMFEKRGFQFPATLVAGNPTTRKAYDEGYLVLDSNNKLFHLKMVNGKPFLKNTNMPADIKPLHISPIEPNDRSFYAFVFDENKKLYIISTDDYKFIEIPCPELDINKDALLIMANPLYWNVNVMSERGKTVFAIKADTKEWVDSISFEREKETKKFINHLFPFELKFESVTSEYIKPVIELGTLEALFVNLVVVFIFMLITRLKKQKIRVLPIIWIIFTGIFGFIPILILRK